MSRYTLPTIAIATATTVLITGIAWGWATTLTVAGRSQKVPKSLAAAHHWPEGSLELVNDPLRWRVHEVWVNGTLAHYVDYRPETKEDLARLVRRTCEEIPWSNLTVYLHPDAEARFVSALDEYAPGNRISVILRLSEPIRGFLDDAPRVPFLDFDNFFLPPSLNGIRREQLETSLTLYTGSPLVDLSTLQIPLHLPLRLPRKNIYIDETTEAYRAMVAFARAHEEKKQSTAP